MRDQQIKLKAWDISRRSLPVNPEPNTVYFIKQTPELLMEVVGVDSSGQYLTLDNNIFGSEFNSFSSSGILTNNSETTKVTAVSGTTSGPLPIGKYCVKVNYSWNLNSTQHDFESYLMVNSSAIGFDSTGLIHKEEPKDAASSWETTKSGQILNFNREFLFDVTSVANRSVSLSFKTSKQNVEASIWDASIQIYRVS